MGSVVVAGGSAGSVVVVPGLSWAMHADINLMYSGGRRGGEGDLQVLLLCHVEKWYTSILSK